MMRSFYSANVVKQARSGQTFCTSEAEAHPSEAVTPGLKSRPPKDKKNSPAERMRAGRRTWSRLGALKFAHELHQRLDGVQAHGVVQRDAHSADGAVPGRADQIGGRSVFAELLLERFVAGRGGSSSHTKHHVHQRARRFLHRTAVKTLAAIDGVVKKLGLGFIAFLNAGQAAFRGDP